MISGSSQPEAVRLKVEIEGVRKKRRALIDEVRAFKRRLNYKSAEGETIEKFLKGLGQAEQEAKMKKVGMLKKQKARFEFKISTEASSLSDEKALIRKINEIEKELNEELRTVRLFRKRELVKKDIEELVAKVTQTDSEISELDKQLDVLYDSLRKFFRAERRVEDRKRGEKKPPLQLPEVNLEDIVVIKKKK